MFNPEILEGFDWDEGNASKNWERHKVTQMECEQVFFNRPILSRLDEQHMCSEPRFQLIGQTDKGRVLFVAFTVRETKIRIISTRDVTTKEKKVYDGKRLKEMPQFENEDQEREFWASADSTDYLDWSKAEQIVFPNLKPTTKTISMRLPKKMLEHLKAMANEMDIPYQSMVKMLLDEKIRDWLRGKTT